MKALFCLIKMYYFHHSIWRELPVFLNSNEYKVSSSLLNSFDWYLPSNERVAVKELREEEGIDAIGKWLEENPCPLKSSKPPTYSPGLSDGDLQVLKVLNHRNNPRDDQTYSEMIVHCALVVRTFILLAFFQSRRPWITTCKTYWSA